MLAEVTDVELAVLHTLREAKWPLSVKEVLNQVVVTRDELQKVLTRLKRENRIDPVERDSKRLRYCLTVIGRDFISDKPVPDDRLRKNLPRAGTRRTAHAYPQESDFPEWIRRYTELGHSMKQIASDYGVMVHDVRNVLRRAGVEIRKSGTVRTGATYHREAIELIDLGDAVLHVLNNADRPVHVNDLRRHIKASVFDLGRGLGILEGMGHVELFRTGPSKNMFQITDTGRRSATRRSVPDIYLSEPRSLKGVSAPRG